MTMICGAKKRNKDEVCQSNVLMANVRCRLHGGASLKGIASKSYKDGKHSKYAYLPETLNFRSESLLNDNLKNLEECIQIQKSLETTYLEKLGTNESTEAWTKLNKAVHDYDEAAYTAKNEGEKHLLQAQAFGMIRFLVKEGLSESFLHSDIARIHESQRKLTETLSKCRKEQQEIYTVEELNQILGIFLDIVRRNITDINILSNIQTEISSFQNNEDANLIGWTTDAEQC